MVELFSSLLYYAKLRGASAQFLFQAKLNSLIGRPTVGKPQHGP